MINIDFGEYVYVQSKNTRGSVLTARRLSLSDRILFKSLAMSVACHSSFALTASSFSGAASNGGFAPWEKLSKSPMVQQGRLRLAQERLGSNHEVCLYLSKTMMRTTPALPPSFLD